MIRLKLTPDNQDSLAARAREVMEDGGIVVFPATFSLDEIQAAEVRIRGEYYPMPELPVTGDR